ncbi:MAG TPA: nickel-binding protein [Dehalococcoidia bacterium]|jgi:class 3 adenylate cyclase|nr:nickel-binding protein [Dehalococcoidia bacterium]
MPLFMDAHKKVEGATVQDVANAHMMDLKVQDNYGVKYLRYWFNQQAGKVFCLVHAPNAEAAVTVHEKAHGLVPEEIIEVQETLVEAFMGTASASLEASTLPAEAGEAPGLDPGFRTILFTDMVGSTALTQRLGDEEAMRLVRVHDHIIRGALHTRGGHEIKHTGDGIMAAFVSPRRAVECAIDVQKQFAIHNENQDHPAIQVRIGLSAGEPVEENRDLFGACVQLAARLCAHAEPGRILVPGLIRELCMGKGFRFVDVGNVQLKGFDELVRVYEVKW